MNLFCVEFRKILTLVNLIKLRSLENSLEVSISVKSKPLPNLVNSVAIPSLENSVNLWNIVNPVAMPSLVSLVSFG